jgi:hypothetical protein
VALPTFSADMGIVSQDRTGRFLSFGSANPTGGTLDGKGMIAAFGVALDANSFDCSGAPLFHNDNKMETSKIENMNVRYHILTGRPID